MNRKILVVSDTHGSRDILRDVIRDTVPFDIVIHCGDGVTDICSAEIPENSMLIAVAGNTDLYSECSSEEIIRETISGRNIMITHGHRYNVKAGLYSMIEAATGSDIVLFGHTHEQTFRPGKPVLFNPGNLSGGKYGIIYASDDGEWKFEHKKIKKG